MRPLGKKCYPNDGEHRCQKQIQFRLLDSPNRKNKNEGYENEYDQENLFNDFPSGFLQQTFGYGTAN